MKVGKNIGSGEKKNCTICTQTCNDCFTSKQPRKPMFFMSGHMQKTQGTNSFSSTCTKTRISNVEGKRSTPI